MKFFLSTLAVLAMLGFAVATIVEIVVSLGRIFTGHPFKTLGSLFLALVFGLITYGMLKVAKGILAEEPA